MKTGYKEIGFGKQTIAEVFEEWYTVPSYQRHYVWESDNVNDMLEDFTSNYAEHGNEGTSRKSGAFVKMSVGEC